MLSEDAFVFRTYIKGCSRGPALSNHMIYKFEWALKTYWNTNEHKSKKAEKQSAKKSEFLQTRIKKRNSSSIKSLLCLLYKLGQTQKIITKH